MLAVRVEELLRFSRLCHADTVSKLRHTLWNNKRRVDTERAYRIVQGLQSSIATSFFAWLQVRVQAIPSFPRWAADTSDNPSCVNLPDPKPLQCRMDINSRRTCRGVYTCCADYCSDHSSTEEIIGAGKRRLCSG